MTEYNVHHVLRDFSCENQLEILHARVI